MSRKQIGYIVLLASSNVSGADAIDKLMKAVVDGLSKGWETIGGIAINSSAGEASFAQAMAKYEESA